MMRWFIVSTFVLFPFFAMAQQVPVQTGEHSSFTRVVLTTPPNTTWQLGRGDDGYLLRMPDVAGYDLRRFFDLIPRTRIEDVSEGDVAGELKLYVSCACYADAFLDSPRVLVIDIRDGIATENASFEAFLDPPDPIATSEPARAIAQPYDRAANRLFPVIFPSANEANQSETNTQPQQPVIVEPASDMIESQPLAQAPSARETNLSALEQSITESLSRGLSQGVLNADLETKDRGSESTGSGDLIPPGLQTRTGINFSALPPDPRISRNQEGLECLPDDFFDVGQWGNDNSFSEQMSMARANLTGEFDRMDEAAVTAKARLFLFFGFGREAIQTLQLDGTSSQERQFLTAIAQIIDGDPVTSELFERQVSCQSSVALWAMLANAGGPLDGKVDSTSVLRAFKALPTRLQEHLGPSLSEKFLNIGDEESALQALAVANSTSVPTVDAQLAETALLRGLGETDGAIENLTDLARTSVGATPETMVAFFDAVIAGEIIAQDADFMLADALRFENAMLPLASDLGELQARAHIAQDRFSEAQDLMLELSDDIDFERLTGLINDFTKAATAHMTDADFLELAFDMKFWPTTDKAQNDMARRLLALGFPEQASLLIEGPAGEILQTDRAALRAEVALMLGQPETALLHLDTGDGVSDPELRQAALDVLSGTVSIPNLEGETTDTQDLWRRGEWAMLATGEDQLLRDASVAVLEQNEAPLEPDTPLASGRMLLGQSAAARAVVDDLLDRFAVQSDY